MNNHFGEARLDELADFPCGLKSSVEIRPPDGFGEPEKGLEVEVSFDAIHSTNWAVFQQKMQISKTTEEQKENFCDFLRTRSD